MNRLERFRTARQIRIKYLTSFTLFFVLVIVGICAVDYSVNSITKNQNKIDIISLKNIGDSQYELNFANEVFQINTKYVKRDYQRLKNVILGLFD